jgi:8-oxo-dGTP pyrophosphatase MutT (NUDIX family)
MTEPTDKGEAPQGQAQPEVAKAKKQARARARARQRANKRARDKAKAQTTDKTTDKTTRKTTDKKASPKPARKPAKARRAGQPGLGPVQKEVSAGGVVYRGTGADIEVVLASRRTRRGQLAWGLAKGGIEEGESLEEAAVREVLEETGLRAVIEGSLGDTRYFYVWEQTRIRKTVHFFLMRVTQDEPSERDDEMEEIRWFPIDRALKRAAYLGEREVIGRAAELLR